jgi:hypothetical protein
MSEHDIPVSAVWEWASLVRRQAEEITRLLPNPKILPGTHAIFSLYAERLESFVLLFTHGPQSGVNVQSLIAEFSELRPYILESFANLREPGFYRTAKELVAEQLVRAGMPSDEALALMKALQQRGKPPERTELYLTAYDMNTNQVNKKNIPTIVRELCPCPNHTKLCAEQFRTGIREIRQLLRKYGKLSELDES